MPDMIVKARVRKDGALEMSKGIRQKLHLLEGEEVELTVRRPTPTNGFADDTLLQFIGLSNGGREDGSVNHDTYLYGAEAE
jgi:hypothetical protein